VTVDAGISGTLRKLRFWHVVSRLIRYALSVASRYRRAEDDVQERRPRSVLLDVARRRDTERISRERERRRRNSWNQTLMVLSKRFILPGRSDMRRMKYPFFAAAGLSRQPLLDVLPDSLSPTDTYIPDHSVRA
jgi:hypothetical protein